MDQATFEAIKQDIITPEISCEEIASKYGIPVDTVYDILDELLGERDNDDDGQPDEYTEWMDYDPDC